MTWDEWRGSLSGDVVMRVKHLIHWRGFKLDLHKMIAPDATDCFHTHPAKAVRWVLWGGYVEQLEDVFDFETWFPGRLGVVRPETSHRVDGLIRGPSYSLWLRWPKTHAIELRGTGWPS